MARKRKKRKMKKPENEYYEIELGDWEVNYHFGINTGPKDLVPGVYWEHSAIIMPGKILSPVIEKANEARIQIAAEPQMDDHWKAEPTIISAKATGWMEIPRGDDTLIFHCSIPSQSFHYVALAAHSRKIKFASISGTKRKWRQGTISNLRLSSHRDEE